MARATGWTLRWTLLILFSIVGTMVPPARPSAAAPLPPSPSARYDQPAPPFRPRVPSVGLPPRDGVPAGMANIPARPDAEALAQQQASQPLAFIPNRGQFEPQVAYQAQAGGSTFFFTPDGVALTFASEISPTTTPQPRHERALGLRNRHATPPKVEQQRIHITFEGALPTATITGGQQLQQQVNYLYGRNAAANYTHLPTYGTITYQGLYPGVDMRYEGQQGMLKSTYVVAPHADPNQIRWRYAGVKHVRVHPQTGDLTIQLQRAPGFKGEKTLTERAPIAWQVMDGVQVPVEVAYQVDKDGHISFVLGAYDSTQPLIIDPELTYSTVIGGDGDEGFGDTFSTDAPSLGNLLTIREDGTVLFAADTTDASYPITPGVGMSVTPNDDDKVTVLTQVLPDGQIGFSTYIAILGAQPAALTNDASGQIYLTGVLMINPPSGIFTTTFGDFGYIDGNESQGQQHRRDPDIFVLTLPAEADEILEAVGIGGYGDEEVTNIALDSTGTIYLVGGTNSYTPTLDSQDNIVVLSGDVSFPITRNLPPPPSTIDEPFNMQGFFLKLSPDRQSIDGRFISESTEHDNFLLSVAINEGQEIAVGGVAMYPLGNEIGHYPFVAWLSADGTTSSTPVLLPVGGNDTGAVTNMAYTADGRRLVAGYTQTGGFLRLYAAGNVSFSQSVLPGGFIYAMVVDDKGRIYLAGAAEHTLPLTSDAIPHPIRGEHAQVDGFLAVVDATGQYLGYSTLLGGSEIDVIDSLQLTHQGKVALLGYTESVDYPTTNGSTGSGMYDVSLAQIDVSDLPDDLSRCVCDSVAQPTRGYNTNTHTGNMWTDSPGMLVETPGSALGWTAIYNSQALTETDTDLSPGWQHPYATRLITEDMGLAGGEEGLFKILTPQGNIERFAMGMDGATPVFTATAGVESTLSWHDATDTYRRTLPNQHTEIFDVDGRLIEIVDPQQRSINLTYTNGRLSSVVDADNSQRGFSFGYTAGKLTTVTDLAAPTRAITYTYTSGGAIETIQDVMRREMTYTYETNRPHLLTGITNPLGQPVMRTSYTSGVGIPKVLTQTLGLSQHVAFDYADSPAPPSSSAIVTIGVLNQSSLITTTGLFGVSDTETISYTLSNYRHGREFNGLDDEQLRFDANFNPSLLLMTDPTTGLTAATRLTYARQGMPTSITNALGQTSRAQYDTETNQLEVITSTTGLVSRFDYDTAGRVLTQTVGITTANPLGFTTRYTYTAEGWLSQTSDPRGVLTTYQHNSVGQVLTQTLAAGTADAQMTTYGYDGIGRVITTTTLVGTDAERTDLVTYRNDGSIAQTVQNYRPTTSDPLIENLTTTYGYDGLGRQIWVEDPNGQKHATHYNAHGQVDWTAQNWTGSLGDLTTPTTSAPTPLPGHLDENVATSYGYDGRGRLMWTRDPAGVESVTQYDSQGRVAWNTRNYTGGITTTLPAQPPAYSPATPDANVTTFYGYDGFGRTALVTETGLLTGSFNLSTREFASTTTRATYTEYDLLGRPLTVTLNYEDGVFDAAQPDRDLQQVTVYDDVNRTVTQIDTRGRTTVTQHDTLNRPITVTVNYENGNPETLAPTTAQEWGMDADLLLASTDLMQVTRYRPDGLVDLVIENYRGDGTFDPNTPTASAWNRATRYEYDVLGRVITTTLNYVPTAPTNRPDLNHVQVTRYDGETGRVVGQRDTIGRWTVFNYDVLGRTTGTIQHCTDEGGVIRSAWWECSAAVNSLTIVDSNAQSQTWYDILGRPVEQMDSAGRITRSAYDDLGRVVQRIDNYKSNVTGSGTYADTNLTTSYQLDVLGRAEVITDPLGRTTTTQYDDLGRAWHTTDSAGRVSENGGDAGGLRSWRASPGSGVSVTEADLLGRPVRSIANYHNGTLDGDPVDRDLITTTSYSGDAQIRTVIAPDGQKTQYGYDLLDRLVWVLEGMQQSCASTRTDCNILTQYYYDRVGNRIKMIDARGNVRQATFDAANNELERWTDGVDVNAQPLKLVHQVRTYDALGRLVSEQPALDATKLVTYTYDGLDRLTHTKAPNASPVLNITRTYDPLPAGGQLAGMQDASGTTSYDYDALGRPLAITNGAGQTVGYRHNVGGQRTQLTYPGGAIVLNYTYTLDGQMETVNQGTTTLATYVYNTDGQLTQLQRSAAMTTTYAYDDLGRIAQLRTTAATGLQVQQDYTLDRAGLRTEVGDVLIPARTFDKTSHRITNGTANGQDRPRVVTTDADGNVYQVSTVTSNNNRSFDIHVAKYTSDLQLLWEYTYDNPDTSGTRPSDDVGHDVLADEAGFVYVTGRTRGTDETNHAITLVFSPTAVITQQLAWRGLYTGTGYDDEGRKLALGSDGTLYVAGHRRVSGTNQDWLLLRYTPTNAAKTTWTAQTALSYGGGSNLDDEVVALELDGSGNAVLAGTAQRPQNGFASEDIAVRVYSPSGSLSRELYYHNNGPERATALALADDGTIYVTGWRQLNTFKDILTLKFAPSDTSASQAWTYNRTSINKDDVGMAVETGPDGTVYVSGKSQNSANTFEYITLAYTPTVSTAAWNSIYPYAALAPADTLAMQQDGLEVDESGYVYVGVAINRNMGSNTDLRMLVYSPTGELVAEGTPYDGGTNGHDTFASFSVNVAQGSGSHVYLSGYIVTPGPDDDAILLAYQPFTITHTTYAYDDLHRLTDATERGGTTYGYAYDRAGNRTSATEDGQVVGVWDYNEADQVTNTGWSYDHAGNLTSDGTQSHTYDALGRLTGVTAGSTTTSHSYNGDGVLMGSTVGSASTSYVQDLAGPLSQVLVQQPSAGSATTFLYGEHRLASLTGGIRRWELQDALGSTRLTLSDSAAVQTQMRFDPWGTSVTGTPAPFGFTGELQDSATGLTYLRARWYHIGTGRFIAFRWQTDESDDRLPLSHHAYAYAHSNPILYTDPTGKCIPIVATACRAAEESFPADPNDIRVTNPQSYDPNNSSLFISSLADPSLLGGDVYWDTSTMVKAIYLWEHPRSFGDKLLGSSYIGLGAFGYVCGNLGTGLLLALGGGEIAGYFSGKNAAGNGDFRNWQRINERPDPTMVTQSTEVSCGPACAEAILRQQGVTNVTQQAIEKITGAPTTAQNLERALNYVDKGRSWIGGPVNIPGATKEQVMKALNQTGSWIAQLRTGNSSLDHFLIVDGLDDVTNMVAVRDPWAGTQYMMHLQEFLSRWPDIAIFAR